MRLSQINSIEGADRPNHRYSSHRYGSYGYGNDGHNKYSKHNKRCFSANGFSLLPLALRPRLFCSTITAITAITAIAGLAIGLFMCSNPTFAVDPCTGSATCLNVSIANSISLDLKPVSNSGTFASSSTTDNTVSVTTNYFSGYKLSIAASTANDNTLKYEENNVVLATIPSHNIVAGISANNYADDTYASTNHLNNTWGYRPSKLNSTDNTNYLPGPTSTTDTTLDSTTTANPETANNYNIAIGARVDMTTPKGLYANTFVIKVVANPIPYTITYNKNTEDTVTNMPANVNTTTMDTSVTVGNAPSRSGYNFVGWCTGIVADGNTCDNPHIPYAAGGNYAIDQVNGGNNLTLYAVWGKPTLYETVAAMSKGKNTAENNFSWTSITKPTSTDPSIDTSTSGVYEWGGKDGTDTGADSNGGSNPIYFYRGVLDTTVATYGSDGLADAYPNYVILSSASDKNGLITNDTCWRIVRTTSTGGVKMIYNGTWAGSTCANVTTAVQTTTSPFNTDSATVNGKTYTGLQQKNIHATGYTYSDVPASTTSAKTPAELFGASGNDTTTNSNSSIMKQYIEDWYASTLTSYTGKLEGDAGYCQDRRLNTGTTWTTPLAEDSNTIIPYGLSGLVQYYFGAYPRNGQFSTFNPLLTCPRGKVDLYSYSGNAGNGNGQLAYPVALLTADEVSMAGSGYSNPYNAYNANSYLRSGGNFWLLSPSNRSSGGYASEFSPFSGGYLLIDSVGNVNGVRPAISLTSGTTAVGGTGIATDPWIVNPPPSP